MTIKYLNFKLINKFFEFLDSTEMNVDNLQSLVTTDTNFLKRRNRK